MSDLKTITELLAECSGYTEQELQERMTEPILQPYDILQAVLKYVSKANEANKQPDTKALDLLGVVPCCYEINFDGNLKTQIEIKDNVPTVTVAVNGWGEPVNIEATIITQLQ